ncbi:MAG TPA: hypothetical protein VGB92_18125 [Longimicrobium sp.]
MADELTPRRAGEGQVLPNLARRVKCAMLGWDALAEAEKRTSE